MTLKFPRDVRIAVNIGTDFDAQSIWARDVKTATASGLSRGEFGAKVGVQRLLRLYEYYDIRSTFFTPTHTMETFPREFETVLEGQHEIAAHGVFHEYIPGLEPDEERRLMDLQIEKHQRIVGVRPWGYRSPAWDFSDITMNLIDEFEFKWDSSLMGRDFHPYRPRPVEVNLENGNTFGAASRFVEYPVSWYLDDLPPLEYIPGIFAGFGSIQTVVQSWIDQFDYAYDNEQNAVLCLTIHPQCIGRAHHIIAFEDFIRHVKSRPGARFMAIGDIHEYYEDDTVEMS